MSRAWNWISGMVACLFLLLFAQPVHAAVYKWKDDQGKIHFTDDESKIPPQYRDKSHLEKIRGMREKVPSPESESTGSAATDEEKKQEQAKNPQPADAKKMSAEEMANIQAAIEYLQKEIQRDEGLIEIMPSELNGKYFVASIQQSLPQKQALADRIAKSEASSLKATHSFLQTSVQQDEEVHVTGPLMKTRTIQLLGRLKSEMGQEAQLIEQLKADLAKAETEAKSAETAAAKPGEKPQGNTKPGEKPQQPASPKTKEYP